MILLLQIVLVAFCSTYDWKWIPKKKVYTEIYVQTQE